MVADKIIPDGQGDRVQSVVISSSCDRHAEVTVKMVATEDFLKCLTPCPPDDVSCVDCGKPTAALSRFQYVENTGRVIDGNLDKTVFKPLCRDCYDKRIRKAGDHA
jgi:hypothetical protein